jgi:hypothetical protein
MNRPGAAWLQVLSSRLRGPPPPQGEQAAEAEERERGGFGDDGECFADVVLEQHIVNGERIDLAVGGVAQGELIQLAEARGSVAVAVRERLVLPEQSV